MRRSSAPSLLRVEIDDIHHIRRSLRCMMDKYQFLRLSVGTEDASLSCYLTPKGMENGELDFDRQIIFPLKENLKSLFFHLYDFRPGHSHPIILASGRVVMEDILGGSSTWTVPLLQDGEPACKIAFYAEPMHSVQSDDAIYYAPSFASPLQEVASTLRRITKPACLACQSVVVGIFTIPVRTGCIFALSLNHLFHSLFSKSYGD